VLSGKKRMLDAAQSGVHRFRPKSVFPDAPLALHDDQCVDLSSLFASAQESTTVPVGLMSGEPLQLSSLGEALAATAVATQAVRVVAARAAAVILRDIGTPLSTWL
jgi:ABC-type uncharacterized transport system involved in gliding motility auxiliary subunit